MLYPDQLKEAPVKIAVVGLGKIALDQHLPSIAADSHWQLAATVSNSSSVRGIDNFLSVEQLLQRRPDISTISLCVPPEPRFNMAIAALRAGKHVMLEKPPGASVCEVETLADLAQQQGVTLFTTWHSREAPKVDLAREWLQNKTITKFKIVWREDVRRWHPGQDWVWQPAGLGVFDPGINALSILTKILPEPVRINHAQLAYPANRNAPIAAVLKLQSLGGAIGSVNFDWRETGDEIWEIAIRCGDETLELKEGGARLFINGTEQSAEHSTDLLSGEYPRLYRRMHTLQSEGRSEVDLLPLQLVADAMMLAERASVEPFEF